MKLKFQINKIKFKKPIYTHENCRLKEKTYAISIYVPIKIKYNNKLVTQREIVLIQIINL